MPVFIQAESAECGLACISMISYFYESNQDIRELRLRFPISLKGSSFDQLIKILNRLQFDVKALKVDLEEIGQVRLPCILHWDFNHYVVLSEIKSSKYIIHDPAVGKRILCEDDFSKSYTGVLLEVVPELNFETKEEKKKLNLKQIFGKIRGLKTSLFYLLMLSFCLEIFTVIMPLSIQWVTDQVLVNGDRDLLVVIIFVFSILIIVQQGIGLARSWASINLGVSMSFQWKANVFSHLLKLPVGFFERRHVGDIVSRFGSIDSIHQTLTASILSGILDLSVTIISLVAMFLYSPQMALIPVVAMFVYVAGRFITFDFFSTFTKEGLVKSAKTSSHFLETIRGVRSIKLYQKNSERKLAWQSLLADQVNNRISQQKYSLGYQQVNSFIFGVEGLVLIYMGANSVMNGDMSIGMFVAFNSFKGFFNSRVSQLVDNFFSLKIMGVQIDRLSDIILSEAEPASDVYLDGSQRRAISEVRVDNIQYRYAHGEKTILYNVSFSLKPGSFFILMGESGCGKTTLFNILLGVLKPTKGNVVVDGLDLDAYGVDNFRKNISVVSQDDCLFSGSLADNISFFDSSPDLEKVVNSAIMSGIHQDIISMPMGYNTLVGDMGSVLSGGQKQRVLIARALYRNSSILFMDEPTCHLDLETEMELFSRLKSLGVSIFVITHRKGIVRFADYVMVLKNGRVDFLGGSIDFARRYDRS